MALTWAQFRTATKQLLSDLTASDDLFAAACAAYVKAMVCREVDHDLLLSKSYWNSYQELKRRLLGYSTFLVVGSTLDVAVKKLLPVDADREGIQTYLTQQIKNAYSELTSVSAFIEKLMREAVIDMQSYILCYRMGQETIFTEEDVVQVGNLSRGPMPEAGEFQQVFFLTSVDDLAIDTEYAAGDYVVSNGRIYRVLTSGTVSDLGDGLLTTNGTVELLDGVNFTFIYGEGCFRSEIVPIPWSERFTYSAFKDGCASKDDPAVMAIDPETYSFFLWPKLDATHTLSVFWNGLKFEFADSDTVPFDESVQQAVSKFVLARYYLQVEHDAREASMHEALYKELRARAFADCNKRGLIEFSNP